MAQSLWTAEEADQSDSLSPGLQPLQPLEPFEPMDSMEPLELATSSASGTMSTMMATLNSRLTVNCTSYLMATVNGVGAEGEGNELDPQDQGRPQGIALDEFQIIKAVVLGLVTCIILLSVCKMVFQLFVRYAAKIDER